MERSTELPPCGPAVHNRPRSLTALTNARTSPSASMRTIVAFFSREATMAFASAEVLRRILEELEGLDAEEREVVRRHYFDGEPLETVAASLNISKSWASRLHT